jgi:hypothetical protein
MPQSELSCEEPQTALDESQVWLGGWNSLCLTYLEKKQSCIGAAQMPSAAYYRLLAKECFQSADQEQDNAKAEILRARGREYSELAQAFDLKREDRP